MHACVFSLSLSLLIALSFLHYMSSFPLFSFKLRGIALRSVSFGDDDGSSSEASDDDDDDDDDDDWSCSEESGQLNFIIVPRCRIIGE